jgi:hypothetical protein
LMNMPSTFSLAIAIASITTPGESAQGKCRITLIRREKGFDELQYNFNDHTFSSRVCIMMT